MADYMMRRRDQGPPSPFRDRLRFGIIFIAAIVGLGALLARYDADPGSAAMLGLGIWLSAMGTVNLVYLMRGDLDRVWLPNREASIMASIGMMASGDALMVLSFLL